MERNAHETYKNLQYQITTQMTSNTIATFNINLEY